MYSKEKVGLFLLALEDGMCCAEAARFAGVRARTAERWARGRLPHGFTGRPAAPLARIVPEPAPRRAETPLDRDERAAYDAAMEENVLLRAVLADLKAEGCAPASMSNARKCALGERLRRETGLPLRPVTAFLRISKSSYECHRARMGRRRDRDADIRAEVRRLFEASGRSRGYREVWARLRGEGVRASEKRVLRVMREEGLRPAYARRRRRGYSSYAGEVSAAPPNLVGRRFRAGAPDELWLTDITEFRLPSGAKACLSPVVDCFDGKPVAWSAGTRPDNAVCEGFFGRLKNEFFYYRDWEGVGRRSSSAGSRPTSATIARGG